MEGIFNWNIIKIKNFTKILSEYCRKILIVKLFGILEKYFFAISCGYSQGYFY